MGHYEDRCREVAAELAEATSERDALRALLWPAQQRVQRLKASLRYYEDRASRERWVPPKAYESPPLTEIQRQRLAAVRADALAERASESV